jgi:uncharacterized membrane protein YqjE
VHDAPDAARRVAATLLELACTRVELGATELAEERERFARHAVLAVLALLGLVLGLVWGVIALAWWAGPQAGALVLVGASLAALLAAAAAVALRQRSARSAPPLLHETLAQLRADARAFAPHRSASAP